MGRILWPNKMARELKADLKHLRKKATQLVDEWVRTDDSIQKVKWRLKQLKDKQK
jgi:hypothetical protein